jgi:phage/plasmid-associated DNA primase
MPKIDVEEAINKRIIMFPMNNKFKTNSKFKDELFENKDILFSFILQRGDIRDELILSQEMEYSKADVIEDNKFDPFEEFFNEKLVKFETSKMKRDEVFPVYVNWLKENQYKLNKELTPKKFTRDMKTKFGVDNIRSGGSTYLLGIKWNISCYEIEHEP